MAERYQKDITSYLKKNQTTSEKILWNRLRNRQFLNLKFRRQHRIHGKIVDFYCPEIKLIIEVDGKIHDKFTEADASRDDVFNHYGYRVVRIKNEDINLSVNEVLEKLRLHIQLEGLTQ